MDAIKILGSDKERKRGEISKGKSIKLYDVAMWLEAKMRPPTSELKWCTSEAVDEAFRSRGGLIFKHRA